MTAKPSETREEVEKLERKHAENPEGRYFVPLANAYRKAGELDRAIRVLRDGLEKHADYLSAHIVMGRCLADTGDAEAAEAEFRYVLTLDPQNLIALRTLGELALAAGGVAEAERWYRELLKADPMNEDARRALDGIQMIPAPAPPTDVAPAPAETPVVAAWDEPATTGSPVPEAEPEPEPEPVAARGAVERPAEAADFDILFGGPVELEEGPASVADEVPFPMEGQAVVTETIAELYTRQGFYSRAAEVYRELLRRRGPRPDLEERLRRVEALAAGAAPETAAAPDSPAPGSDAPRPSARPAEPDLAPPAGLSAFEAGPGAGVFGDVLDLDDDTRIAAAAADAFAESFLAGFTPLDEPDAPDYGAPLPGLTGTAVEGVREAETVDLGAAPPPAPAITIGEYLAGVLSWTPGAEPAGGGAAAPVADDHFPWEVPATSPPLDTGSAGFEPPREAPAPTATPEAPVRESAPPAPPAGFEASGLGPASTPAAEPPPPVSPPAGAPPAAEPAAPASDDEDLESFQAWLRSLKR